jgi:hypothetical protein
LAEGHQAVQTDNSFCASALTAATLESLQVADRSAKVISGQVFVLLTFIARMVKFPAMEAEYFEYEGKRLGYFGSGRKVQFVTEDFMNIVGKKHYDKLGTGEFVLIDFEFATTFARTFGKPEFAEALEEKFGDYYFTEGK